MKQEFQDPENFFVIPTHASVTTEEEKKRYLQRVRDAKARMRTLGLVSLLDKPIEKQESK